MESQTIYFPFVHPPRSGDDYVALEHLTELDRQGFHARVLYLSEDGGEARFSAPLRRRREYTPRERDIYVLGDLPFSVLSPLRVLNCVRLSLNSNLLRLEAFATAGALNTYPFAAIIAPSEFAARRLRELGVTHDIKSLHPIVPPEFKPQAKVLQIAHVAAHREVEARALRAAFHAAYPQFARVPWVPISNLERGEIAAALSRAAIYAALPQPDTLALTTLEAMACGCRVVGYPGLAGADFVNGEGGAWITEGDSESFCRKLAEACQDIVREGQVPGPGAQVRQAASAYRDDAAKRFHHAVGALYTGFMGVDPARFLR